MKPPGCILLMGVSGSGKTTVGRLLAERLGGAFVDADDLHPPANLQKMRSGRPLTDDDRWPWLDRVAQVMAGHHGDAPLVVACSALKEAYRRRLGPDRFRLVYLKGTHAAIARRLRARKDHFMPPALLASQFADLEEPSAALTVSVADPPEAIARHIVNTLFGPGDGGRN